ncbi:uncharacterized protein MEPE_02872 [Melanopsichium pennsylvanicum]|uniref:Uncharacterized protein n=1 Tax=Melanopsichium pennsylvanicum TaxID=63383 RepID=A0AAJ5C548_9BASI|nr:uncharacterized protein MEPE_02872 [Melanopsichium pennsylvanicum]
MQWMLLACCWLAARKAIAASPVRRPCAPRRYTYDLALMLGSVHLGNLLNFMSANLRLATDFLKEETFSVTAATSYEQRAWAKASRRAKAGEQEHEHKRERRNSLQQQYDVMRPESSRDQEHQASVKIRSRKTKTGCE